MHRQGDKMGKNYDYVKVPREILESMGKIVEYCWNERKHFEEHFNVEMIEDNKFVNSESGEEFVFQKPIIYSNISK